MDKTQFAAQVTAFMIPAVLAVTILTHLAFFIVRRLRRWVDAAGYERRIDDPKLPPYLCRQEFLDDLFGKASIADILERCRGLAPSRPIKPPPAVSVPVVAVLGANGGVGGRGVQGIEQYSQPQNANGGAGFYGASGVSGITGCQQPYQSVETLALRMAELQRSSEADVIFDVIKALNREFSKGLDKIVELKKPDVPLACPICKSCAPEDCHLCHASGRYGRDPGGFEGTCPKCNGSGKKV